MSFVTSVIFRKCLQKMKTTKISGRKYLISIADQFIETVAYLSIGSLSSCIGDCKRQQYLFFSMGSHENAYGAVSVPPRVSI